MRSSGTLQGPFRLRFFVWGCDVHDVELKKEGYLSAGLKQQNVKTRTQDKTTKPSHFLRNVAAVAVGDKAKAVS